MVNLRGRLERLEAAWAERSSSPADLVGQRTGKPLWAWAIGSEEPKEPGFPADFFALKSSRLHRELAARLVELNTLRGQRDNWLAPRGSGKSIWLTAYVLYVALEGLEPFIVYTSDSAKQAQGHLESVRKELEDNAAIRRAYLWLRPGKLWNRDQLELPNGVRIEALSTGAKIRGRRNREHRPGLIVVDDPQNVEHVISTLQRERSMAWLQKDLCNAGDHRTNMIVLGTALHQDCIVCQHKRTPSWRTRVYRSIEVWPQRMDHWSEWQGILKDHANPHAEADAQAFYLAHQSAMHEQARGFTV